MSFVFCLYYFVFCLNLKSESHTEKTPLLASWFRSHVASISATSVDFGVTIFLKEIIGLWYVAANAIGAVAGGAVSFIICRRWVFNRKNEGWKGQAFRYVLASGLSAILNTGAVWFLTENFEISYIVSKIIAAVIIGVTINFALFRYFVFK